MNDTETHDTRADRNADSTGDATEHATEEVATATAITRQAVTQQAASAEQAVEAVQEEGQEGQQERRQEQGAGATLGSALGADDEQGADERVMHDDIAAQWELWSMIIGRTAESRLKKIPERIPTMTAAMLGTADGLNLCSVGIPRAEVGRLAALNSSLFAVSAAQASIVSGHVSEPGEAVVSLSTARGSLVLVSFVRQPLGHLVLAVNAADVELGAMVSQVRDIAEDIRAWLGTS